MMEFVWDKNELSVDYTHYVYTKVHIIACYGEYFQAKVTAAGNAGLIYFHYENINCTWGTQCH